MGYIHQLIYLFIYFQKLVHTPNCPIDKGIDLELADSSNDNNRLQQIAAVLGDLLPAAEARHKEIFKIVEDSDKIDQIVLSSSMKNCDKIAQSMLDKKMKPAITALKKQRTINATQKRIENAAKKKMVVAERTKVILQTKQALVQSDLYTANQRPRLDQQHVYCPPSMDSDDQQPYMCNPATDLATFHGNDVLQSQPEVLQPLNSAFAEPPVCVQQPPAHHGYSQQAATDLITAQQHFGAHSVNTIPPQPSGTAYQQATSHLNGSGNYVTNALPQQQQQQQHLASYHQPTAYYQPQPSVAQPCPSMASLDLLNEDTSTNAMTRAFSSSVNRDGYSVTTLSASVKFRMINQLGLQYLKHVASTESKEVFLGRFQQPPSQSIFDVLKDGNCFYRAVSFLMTGSEENYATLRRLGSCSLRKNFHAIRDANLITERTYEEYVKVFNPEANGSYSTEGDIEALASSIRVQIMCFNTHGGYWQVFGGEYNQTIVIYYENNHYQPVMF